MTQHRQQGRTLSPGLPVTTIQHTIVEVPVAIELLPFRDAVSDWRDVALCRDTDPSLFFPVGATGAALDQIAAAKGVCTQCTARQECLEFAIDSNQDSGVWGGLSEDERRQIRRERKAARREMAHN